MPYLNKATYKNAYSQIKAKRNMKSFQDKVVVITGAGSGIGRALAEAFADKGAKLALNDYKTDTLQATVAAVTKRSPRVYSSVFDVADRSAMFSFADAVISEFGQVDIVINNAGIALGAHDFDVIDIDHFERVMAINFNGVLYGSRAFIPHLLQRPEAALLNVSSIFGLAGIAQSTPYCASKFAVNGLNQCLIQEYYDSPLTIHSVHPGGIKTNITRNTLDYKPEHEIFEQELKHSPSFAANKIIKGIQRKKSRILIGQEAYTLDFLTRLFPIFGSRLVNLKLNKTRIAALEAQKQ